MHSSISIVERTCYETFMHILNSDNNKMDIKTQERKINFPIKKAPTLNGIF